MSTWNSGSRGQRLTGCQTKATVTADCKVAYNIYQGWYGGNYYDYPSSTNFVSESGAGGLITTHNDYTATSRTVDSYEPEEYQQITDEFKLQYH
jgi:hypothetical protein